MLILNAKWMAVLITTANFGHAKVDDRSVKNQKQTERRSRLSRQAIELSKEWGNLYPYSHQLQLNRKVLEITR